MTLTVSNKGRLTMTKNITASQALEWLKTGEAILVDVREPDEFKNCHIPFASSLPLNKLDDVISVLEIAPTRKIIFQCLKGARGEKACAVVKNNNIIKNDIFNMEGGINSWADAGFPLVKSGVGISIFRQVQMIVGALIASLIILGFLGLWFCFVLAGIFATVLAIAGFTGWCGLAILLSFMPWNKK